MPLTRISLKTKMTLAVALLAAATLTAMGFFLLRFFEQEIKESVSRQQFALATATADQIDEQLALAHAFIIDAATHFPAVCLEDVDRAQACLDQRLGVVGRSLFDNGIFLFTTDGRLLAETPFREGRRGRDYSHRDYVRQLLAQGKPFLSAPYRSSQEHGHPAVSLAAPVRNAQGGVSAVLAGSLDLTRNNLLGQLSHMRIGETGYFYLFNTDRLMVMHPDPERILQHDVPVGSNQLFDQAIAGFEGSGETVNSRGVPMFSSFKRLKSADWILAANFPSGEAFAGVTRARNYLHAGLAVALLAFTVSVWFFMRFLTGPLVKLIEHVRRLATTGELHEPLTVKTRDEIGLLGRTFNDLMAEIEGRKRLEQEQLLLLQTLIDTIPNPVYFKDLEGRYLGCNLAFESVHGFTREGLIGRTIEDVAGAEHALQTRQSDLELLGHAKVPFQIFERTLTYADGGERDVLFYKAIFFDAEHRPAGVVGTIIDISPRKAVERALSEEREFTENLLQNSAVPCFVIDTRHTVLTWTRACEELTGITIGEVLGTDQHWKAFYPSRRPCLADLIIDGDFRQTIELYACIANSPLIPDGILAEGWFPDVGGKRRYLRFEAAPIHDKSGAIIAAIETLHDLTSLKEAEQALRESEESYRSLIERSPDAILVHRAGKVIFTNEAAARLFAANAAEQLNNRFIPDLIHSDWRDVMLSRISDAEASGQEQPYLEARIVRLDGTALDVEASSMQVYYRGERAVQTILRDITVRKGLQEQVWRQANFDTLTGIPNRLLFLDRLQHSLNRAVREHFHVALFFIDLDRFKEVNDTLGHEAGDDLLRQVAQRINGMLRKTDTLARMGGDEFTIIMPRVTEPPLMSTVAKRILDALALPFTLPGGERSISGSIGIAFFPEDGNDIPTLMKAADAAMYRAKEEGRNRYIFCKPGQIIADPPDRTEEEPGEVSAMPETPSATAHNML